MPQVNPAFDPAMWDEDQPEAEPEAEEAPELNPVDKALTNPAILDQLAQMFSVPRR